MKSFRAFHGILLSALFSLSFASIPVAAQTVTFQYRDFIPADELIYIETAPVRNVIEGVKKLYRGLRGEGGDAELRVLTVMMQAKLGFNVLEAGTMESAGIDTARPIAISVKQFSSPGEAGNGPARRSDAAFFIPARDSLALYRAMKEIMSREGGPGAQPDPNLVEEITKDSLMRSRSSNIFVARAARHIVIANSGERAGSMTRKASRPIGAEPGFAAFTAFAAKTYANRKAVFSYYADPARLQESLFTSAPSSPGEAPGPEAKRFIDELRTNALCEGGIATMDEKGLKVQADSIFKEGYLADRNSFYGRLFSGETHPLSTENIQGRPAIYGRLRFNLREGIDFIKLVAPKFGPQYSAMIANVQQKTGKNIESSLINLLNNNYGFVMERFPSAQGQAQPEPSRYLFSAGYSPENAGTIREFFEKIAERVTSEDKGTRYTRQAYDRGALWKIDTEVRTQTPHMQTQEQKARIDTYYLLLGERELLFGADESLLKDASSGETRAGAAPLYRRLFGVSSETRPFPHLLFHLDMNAVRTSIGRSPAALFAAPVLPYMERMDRFTVTSRIVESRVSAEFNLLLKQAKVKAR